LLFRKLLQLLVIWFLFELAVMIWIGTQIGVFATVLSVLLAAAIGLLLIQRFGYQMIFTAKKQWSAGQAPGHTILKGVLQSVGALLLLFPGFLSDVIALFLFIPATRHWIQQMIFLWMKDKAMRKFR
jgi:UPF0716 protein FxsA